MNRVNVTLRLPKHLAEYVEKKKKELKADGLSKKEVSNQSIIEAMIAYCKEIEDVA
jgi:hypothetical protein